MALKDYLPNFQGALQGFYETSLKETVETKTTEFKQLIQQNITINTQTQQALIAIALAIFLLLALAYFWKDNPLNYLPYKYLALGILIGYLIPYLYTLTPAQ